MTTTQVQYWNYVENHRHNVVTETLSRDVLNEDIRHNKITEAQGDRRLDQDLLSINESIRHNQAAEKETHRHNVATEKVSKGELKVKQKGLKLQAKELKEKKRSNKANESIGQQNANTNAQNAATNARLADLKETEIKNEWAKTQSIIGKNEAETALTKTKDKYYLLDLYTHSSNPANGLVALGLFTEKEATDTVKAFDDYYDYLAKQGAKANDTTVAQYKKQNPKFGKLLEKALDAINNKWQDFQFIVNY